MIHSTVSIRYHYPALHLNKEPGVLWRNSGQQPNMYRVRWWLVQRQNENKIQIPGAGGGESGTLMLQLRAFASCRKSVLDKGTANAEALGWTGA